MKMLKFVSSFTAFSIAAALTVSLTYVTVAAAEQQNDSNSELFPAQENEAEPPLPVETAVEAENKSLDPDLVLHDRQHNITLDGNGSFSGRLLSLSRPDGSPLSAEGMNVRIVRDGSVVASTVTGMDGTFSVTGQSEGVVAIMAFSETGILLFSVRLLAAEPAFATVTPVKMKTELLDLSMSTAIVSGADLAVARDLIFNGLPRSDKRFNDTAVQADQEYPFGNSEAEGSTSLNHHRVQLQADGALNGQVNLLDSRTGRHREITDLTLHFIMNGRHVVATEVEQSGQFHVAGLAPGVYSIVTTGEDGVLAMGVDLIGAAVNAGQLKKHTLTKLDPTLDLSVSPVNATNFNVMNAGNLNNGSDQPTSGAPLAGGGPLGGGGGSFGGGGGSLGGGGGSIGGGGGGLGTVLGAAAAGAIGYAVGNDNDSSRSR